MKFLIDAQLPPRLARELVACGHDAVHTSQLPLGNRTPDEVLAAMAASEDRVLVTKDSDFVPPQVLSREPGKLLLVSTGNTSNQALVQLFRSSLPALEAAFAKHHFVELGQSTITIHG